MASVVLWKHGVTIFLINSERQEITWINLTENRLYPVDIISLGNEKILLMIFQQMKSCHLHLIHCTIRKMTRLPFCTTEKNSNIGDGEEEENVTGRVWTTLMAVAI